MSPKCIGNTPFREDGDICQVGLGLLAVISPRSLHVALFEMLRTYGGSEHCRALCQCNLHYIEDGHYCFSSQPIVNESELP